MTATSSTSETALAQILLANSSSDGSKIIISVAERLSSCNVDDTGFSTATLLAELLLQSSNTRLEADPVEGLANAWETLFTFIHNAFRYSTQLCDIVNICKRLPKLAEGLLRECDLVLRKEALLAETQAVDELAVPTAIFLEPVASSDNGWLASLSLKASSPLVPLDCLAFLKALIWDGTVELLDHIDLLPILLILVGSRAKDLSSSSNDVLLALIFRKGAAINSRGDGGNSSMNRVWQRILELTSTTHTSYYREIGFSLWSRLALFKPFGQSILQQNIYWATLQTGLATGTAQHRKHCLAILKSSLAQCAYDVDCETMKIHSNNLDEYRRQYARYSTLFETIVLARYLNQVQDCLSDLDNISKSESKICKPWILALLTGALMSGVQDSIRKIIGDWTLRRGGQYILPDGAGLVPEFLGLCFLPWASQGTLFTSSIGRKSVATLTCVHGERLKNMLVDVLVFVIDHTEQARIVKAILRFLVLKGALMYPFARAFILEGLMSGIIVCDCFLDTEDIALVLQISSVAGFHSMVRDYMTLVCVALTSRGTEEARLQNNLKPLLQAYSVLNEAEESYEDVTRASEYLFQTAAIYAPERGDGGYDLQLTASSEASVKLFNEWVGLSRNRCLAGPGLEAACSYLLSAFDLAGPESFVADELHAAIEAVWDEFEVQEYPRRMLIKIPHMLFHPNCVRLCPTSSELVTTLAKCALDLQRLAENRVHAFPPLAAALRRAFVMCPEAIELPFVELFVRFANHPPSTKVEFLLEAVMSPGLKTFDPTRTYFSYYGQDERYGHAYLYDTLNRLPRSERWLRYRQQLLDRILDLWIHQKRPPPVSSRWKNSAQLQTVLMISEVLITVWSAEEVDRHLEIYHDILGIEPLPRFRYLWEWIIARIYTHKVDIRSTVQQNLIPDDISNPKLTVSMMKITMILACLRDSDEANALEFMTQLNTLAASPKIVIRHEAHWMIPTMWDHAVTRGWKSILDNPAFARLNNHIRGQDAYKNPPPGRMVGAFDPVKDHTLSNLFQGEYLGIEPSEPSKVSREDFLAIWEDDKGSVPSTDAEHTGVLPLGEARRQQVEMSRSHDVPQIMDIPSESGLLVPLQTKASTWDDSAQISLDSLSVGDVRRAKDVIVISSLINNAYNVGGLSRVSEIFGVESLQVANRNMLKNKDFTSVSVSSHNWLPIEELAIDDIPTFLIDRKIEGYTVVGIEQTDSSKVLGNEGWRFPKKIVLVLGSEREGIPARLLGDMDFCVEIKQVGLTRSMNVQTAAAVVLYEYSKQHP